MKFKDYQYKRPDMEALERDFAALKQEFETGDTWEKQSEIMLKIDEKMTDFATMKAIMYIRHTINTEDGFYEAENDFFDEADPVFQGMEAQFSDMLLNAKFRKELENHWGAHMFNKAEINKRTFRPEVLELLQQENKLSSEYVKLTTSAKILFEGEERNLSQMIPFSEDKDRAKRKSAMEAVAGFFKENEAKYDEIYHNMVQVRHEIALALGYDSFTQLGYDRMTRPDYGPKDVENYRQQVLEYIVPIAAKLRKRQADRLGFDGLKFYDENIKFQTGNAKPLGEEAFLVDQAKKMYTELSPETKEFFDFMMDNELLDLTARKGKAGGGYCISIPGYKSQFIFSNFNGTSGDVDVLTHEAGHAFQNFESRNIVPTSLQDPAAETAEIHSMSMEFFAWPWMELFFGENAEKYRFSHLSGAILFIPYGVAVDEFQYWVYEHPQVTPEQRRKKWRELEQKYLPWRDYDGNEFLENGGFWFRQAHIFEIPFYYIDYTLAQVCALQFWVKSNQNRDKAWADYLKLCQAGGKDSFLKLLAMSGLENPFTQGTIASVTPSVEAYLDSVEDSKL